MESSVILPRVGIGSLRFGQTRDEVGELLGAPDSRDHSIPDREIWEYASLALDASFDSDADWRLVSLSVEHPRYTLRGRALIGLPISEFVKLVRSLGLGTPDRDDDSPFDNPTYEFPQHEVRVSSFDGLVSTISWSVVINARDEYVWPPHVVAA
jgi:hypothetical protein